MLLIGIGWFGLLLWGGNHQAPRLGEAASGDMEIADAKTKLFQNGTWKEGSPVRNQWQAAQAIRLAFVKAAKEKGENGTGYFYTLAKRAPLAYYVRIREVVPAFQSAVGLLAGAPTAKAWLVAVAKEYAKNVEGWSPSRGGGGGGGSNEYAPPAPSTDITSAPSSMDPDKVAQSKKFFAKLTLGLFAALFLGGTAAVIISQPWKAR